MKRFLGLVAASSLTSAAVWAAPVTKDLPPRAITSPTSIDSPSRPETAPAPVPDLFYVRSVVDAAWTPDGKTVVFSTNLTGRFNLWKVSSASGFPEQLTQSDDRQSAIAISPDGSTAVFESDRAGAEIYDLYAVPIAGGPTVDLTSTPDVTETHAIFSPDGKLLAFNRRPKTAPSTDVAVLDVATRQVRVLTHEAAPDHEWSVVAWTRDGRGLIANRANFKGDEAQVFVIDVATGAARAVTREHGFVLASDVSPDGAQIAATVETPAGNRQAALIPVLGGEPRLLMKDVWEQEAGRFSPSGNTLTFADNVDGRVSLYAVAPGQGAPHRLGDKPGVDRQAASSTTSISPDGTRLLYIHQSSTTPPDIWVQDLASGRTAPITRLGLASIDPARLPASQIVHYPSSDGTVISAFFWAPFNAPRNGKAPAIVLPHGGPTGQTLDTFNRTAVALASRGYFVIAPNPRGSTGYGRAFEEANRKDLGGGDLEDEVAGVKFLVATGYVDPHRVGITGGSYGGYMTLMAAAKTPDLWRAAVEEYGIIDWLHMYQTEAPTLQQYQIGLIGDPGKDKAVYEASSPLTYIHHLSAPLLVLQGDNDIRVPRTQALQIVDLLKKDGRTVDVHFYPNEGHGFVKRENQIDALERTIAWFDKYLKGSEQP
ncbi:MAG: S9 family peptidase [Caulobacteraceae bacterium]|nr:S9 family peptidase [Caulobacteraceae bacterium]